MDRLQQPMTKFWTMEIKTPEIANASVSGFDSLLREILDFCYSFSSSSITSSESVPPENVKTETDTNSTPYRTRTKHEFWEEDVENPKFLVLITGYPTLENNLVADKGYVTSGFIPRMGEWVESGRLLLSMRDIDEVPLDAKRIGFEIVEGGMNRQDRGRGGPDAAEVWDAVELVRGQEAGPVQVRLVPLTKQQQNSVRDRGPRDYGMRILRRRL